MSSVLCLFWAAPLQACNVPVFRYALENWPADPYEVLVFHRGPMNAADESAVALLSKQTDGKKVPANVEVRKIDLAGKPDKAMLNLYRAQSSPEPPWMVVRYPVASGILEPAWTGPLRADTVKGFLDSPIRRTVTERILKGESGVWLLLECGDKKKDDDAAELIEAQFRKLEKTLKLQELTDDPRDRLSSKDGPPLRIAFSLVRVSRSDVAEQMLVRMLLHSEPDLMDRKEPMVFSVFGRGRALEAIIGAGINEDMIQEKAAFIAGRCSCEVKRQNPGFDLLMTSDWDALIESWQKQEPVLSPFVGLGSIEPEAAPVEGAVFAAPPAVISEVVVIGLKTGANRLLLRNILMAGGGGLLFVGLCTVLLRHRRLRR